MANYFCLRNLILSCFVLLCISGLIICAVTSYFIDQIYNYDNHNYQLENIQGPLAILLTMGLLTCAFAIYFWIYMDYKYNGLQFIMFTLVLVFVTFIETSVGIWILVMRERMDAILSTSLEESLTIAKIHNNLTNFNVTQLKFDCCGYDESILNLESPSSSQCCDFIKQDEETRNICDDFYGRDCRHLLINRNCSILHRTFLLTLSSVIFQVFVITSIILYAKFLRKQQLRQQNSFVICKPSAPHD
ncbi:hypothetical protein PV328_007875 [Microctonus aethiopoides]|uniref:Tetraspanin n=1 Tax=Microctonus aethiopoides TaxID=144406 RepID=A0AA39CA55_9HYME|nr:hypothetical protein PV328_007875 [Microctonus aethiopoides]